MSFRVGVVLVAILSANVLFADNGEDFLSVGGVAMSRPLVLRSDFATKDVIRRFMCRAQWKTPESTARFVGRHTGLCHSFFHEDYIAACSKYVKGEVVAPPVPKLKNGTICEVGLGFDSFGGSKFGDVVLTKRIHFWETEFVDDYRGAMKRYVAKLVSTSPDKYTKVFSNETIEQYVNWAKNGYKSALNNPVLISGERCEFHHDVASKKMLVLTQSEHRGTQTLSSKGHGSGTNIAGGGNMTWAQKHSFSQYMEMSAVRWGSFAGIDLLSSTITLSVSGTHDKSQYIANAGSVASACLAATLSESLFCTAYPLAAGTTPAWLGFIPICSGGVATWVASGVYMLTRYAVMYGWNQHHIEQARRVEDACKKAEQKARIGLLCGLVDYNSTELNNIVRSVHP